jgi:hypothetical protein
VGLFLLNIAYVVLAIWGALRLWRRSSAVRPAVGVLVVFIVLRTAFLTTLETPEPRYVLVCFPAIIALAAQVFAQGGGPLACCAICATRTKRHGLSVVAYRRQLRSFAHPRRMRER